MPGSARGREVGAGGRGGPRGRETDTALKFGWYYFPNFTNPYYPYKIAEDSPMVPVSSLPKTISYMRYILFISIDFHLVVRQCQDNNFFASAGIIATARYMLPLCAVITAVF